MTELSIPTTFSISLTCLSAPALPCATGGRSPPASSAKPSPHASSKPHATANTIRNVSMRPPSSSKKHVRRNQCKHKRCTPRIELEIVGSILKEILPNRMEVKLRQLVVPSRWEHRQLPVKSSWSSRTQRLVVVTSAFGPYSDHAFPVSYTHLTLPTTREVLLY